MTVALYSYSEVGSPTWWVNRLYQVLINRRPLINMYDDYYCGNFPLPWLAPQAQESFRRVLKMSRANYIGLVVDAQCERMAVEGFRVGLPSSDTADDGIDAINTKTQDPSAADKQLARIWQANGLDTTFDQGLLEAAINGMSYLMVEPNEKDPATPKIYIEHAAQVVVAFAPGSNRRERIAALKVWADDWTGDIYANLYLPDSIHKFESDGRLAPVQVPYGGFYTTENLPIWDIRVVPGEITGGPNVMGMVPIWELPNNPRLLTGGQSEMYDLTDTQDRIVKTIVDRLMAQDFGAFPQKWATGWPEEDSSGNVQPPVEVGRNRMITTEVVETKFGQFSAERPEGYILAKQEDVTDMASRSRTPAQYLLGSMNNVNGDTLKASESGLVAKVRQRMRGHEDPLEDAMAAVRTLAGLAPAAGGQVIETIWRNPEFRTEGELVDSLLKMGDLGVPEEALWERWGATPQEIRRWMAMLEDKMKRAAAGDATVILAERYRQAAAPVATPDTPGRVQGTGAGGGSAAPKPGGGASGGQSSASAAQRRPNAPKPSMT